MNKKNITKRLISEDLESVLKAENIIKDYQIEKEKITGL